jgi:hypothetical protein
MRAYGARSPTELISLPPDTVQTLLVGPGTPQTLDWFGSSVGSAGASRCASRAHQWREQGGALLNCWVDLESTKAAAPSSGNSTKAQAGFGYSVQGNRTFQIPAGSTCFSVRS